MSRDRPSRHWKSAECSLSTGSRSPPPRFQAVDREVAGRDEALLVRESERHAALERPQRRADAGEADDRVQDEVGLRVLEELGEVAADLRVLDAVSAASSSSGWEPDASAHSSARSAQR